MHALLLFASLLDAGASDPSAGGTTEQPAPATSPAVCATSEYVDARDGNRYALVPIGQSCWFASHLRFDARPSYCPAGDEKNCATYGRLYAFETALAACPAGWHLATEHDWRDLELALGVGKEELDNIRERGKGAGERFKALHAARLDELYAGWRRPDGSYSSFGKAAGLWTANDSSRAVAWHRDINIARTGIYRSEVDKSYALSVRCVKNYLETDSTWKPAAP